MNLGGWRVLRNVIKHILDHFLRSGFLDEIAFWWRPETLEPIIFGIYTAPNGFDNMLE